MQDEHYTPQLVEEILLQAGRTLMALRVPGCRPAGYRSGMPDVLPQAIAAEFGRNYLKAEVRTDPPLSVEIDGMDRAMGWITAYLPGKSPASIRHRRVMRSRSLVNPTSDRHVASYREIGSRLGVSHTHVKALWNSGLERIAVGLNGDGAEMSRACQATLRSILSMRQIAEAARNTVARDLA